MSEPVQSGSALFSFSTASALAFIPCPFVPLCAKALGTKCFLFYDVLPLLCRFQVPKISPVGQLDFRSVHFGTRISSAVPIFSVGRRALAFIPSPGGKDTAARLAFFSPIFYNLIGFGNRHDEGESEIEKNNFAPLQHLACRDMPPADSLRRAGHG